MNIYKFISVVMKIFPLDIIAGILLLLGIISMLIGILVYRYRRGKGPLILIFSGILIPAASVIWILGAVDAIVITPIVPGVILIIGIILFIISFLFWRERD